MKCSHDYEGTVMILSMTRDYLFMIVRQIMSTLMLELNKGHDLHFNSNSREKNFILVPKDLKIVQLGPNCF